jgi:hypothetical protein
MMTRICSLCLCLVVCASTAAQDFRRLSVKEYRDKMQAGWLGQMAGVVVGAPTEFSCTGTIVPEDKVPKWQPGMINGAFGQDDLYVEMTFLRSLEQHGIDVPIRQAGIDFANSRYSLWCANFAGRTNLRDGIAPPDSSHPRFSRRSNDIDYQIESDYSGLIAPGLPNVAVALGEKFGRLMNYGDGMYAGQFMGALYCEAFFENDPEKLCLAAVQAIPGESQYAEMVRDMVAWHRQQPDDWQKTWQLAVDKYQKDPAYQKASNGAIDCKINGACVVLGLLYGNRDPDRTIEIALRGGYDSDCNPSSAAGVLFTTMGLAKLPEQFSKELNCQQKFSFTAYSFPEVIDVCEKLAREFVVRAGGKVATENGQDVLLIPVQQPKPSALELTWAPGPIAGSRFTEAEAAQITERSYTQQFVARFPGWSVANCGQVYFNPGLCDHNGKTNVFLSYPKDQQTPAVVSTTASIPAGKTTHLHVVVGHHPQGDFELILRINGHESLCQHIGKATSDQGWATIDLDLTKLAGQTVKIELLSQSAEYKWWDAAYWAAIELISK